MKIKTVLTRDEDIFLKLGERTKIANENNGSLFISIHANAATDRRASGFETNGVGGTHSRHNERWNHGGSFEFAARNAQRLPWAYKRSE